MMIRAVILTRRMLMTGGTELVALMFDASRMRIMTVRTTNPLVIHLALDEGAVNVNFIKYLTIGVVSGGVK